jgi:hypothetical protein
LKLPDFRSVVGIEKSTLKLNLMLQRSIIVFTFEWTIRSRLDHVSASCEGNRQQRPQARIRARSRSLSRPGRQNPAPHGFKLGRKDLLAAHLDLTKLRHLLHGHGRSDDSIKREDVGAIGAWDWGPMLAAHAMWRELGLDTMLDKRAGCARRDGAGLSDRALVLVANGLGEPG